MMPMRSAPARALLPLLALAGAAAAQGRGQRFPTDAPWLHLGLDADIAWIRDPEVIIDAPQTKWQLTAKVDRAALLGEALSRAKADGKLVLWYVFRVVEERLGGRQMYRAPVLDMYAQQVLWADPDVVGIVDAHFVPLRMACDETLSARFSLRPLDFAEPAIVVLDAAGEVVHHAQRIRTFDGLWLADLLRRVLAHAGVDLAAAEDGADPAALIAAGRWEAALSRLQALPAPTASQRVMTAAVLRRLRRPQEAVAALGGLPESDAEAALERGWIHTLTGDAAAAMAALDPAFRGAPAPARCAEAGYLLAWNTLQAGRMEEASALFAQIAKQAPESPWGRRAAANVMIGNDERPVGAAFASFEHFGYLPQPAYSGLPADTAWAGPRRAPDDIARTAVAFLLAQQREHGGFTDCRYAYWGTPKITPNAWVAITALAAAALLEHRDVDPSRVDAAVARAEEYMFDPARLNRGQNEDVYADAYRLLFLARKHARATEADRAAVVQRMNEVIAAGGKRQGSNGFWAHEYPNAFCTAAMTWALVQSRQAGASVPVDTLDGAAEALLSARFKNGAFVYGGRASPKDEGSLKDASGRMPACEAALLALGESDAGRLLDAFKAFFEFHQRLEAVRRNDFHSDGELAGFFYFHDLFHASEANKLLPPEIAAQHDARFLQLLQGIGEMDGSFVDSHEIGRSYGTAMALLVLKNAAGG